MTKKCSIKTLLLLIPFALQTATAQIDTISQYNSLYECTNLSSLIYPTQIARFIPERPGYLQGFVLHTDGEGVGSFKIHLFGQEGGNNYPVFHSDLIPPIMGIKTKPGFESISIELVEPLFINEDQFYIALDNFTADFGLKQDATYYQDFCISKDGGNYYPTILKDASGKALGENCSTTIDVFFKYMPIVPPIFEEVTESAKINTNLLYSSIAWGDIDLDGWQDLLVGSKLYYNDKGIFKDSSKSLNIPASTRVKASAFLDMDNDGDLDILLLNNSQSQLLLNDGIGHFSIKELSLPPLPSLRAYSIADINKDKLPDIVLAQLWGVYPVPLPNFLFLNNKRLDFRDVTKRLYPAYNGIDNFPNELACKADIETTYIPNFNKNRRSRGTQFTDIDLDGDPDLYITNYFLETDELYKNNGRGKFKRMKAPKAINQSNSISNHGTGVDWYDFDNDGDFDLLLPQLAHPNYMQDYDHRGTTIFRNDMGKFTDISATHGIQYEETHAGVSFGDVNNDGLVDILTTAYYACRYIDLYLQQSDHTFKRSTYIAGLSNINARDDACFVDYNNDGLLDVAIGGEAKFHLFKNTATNENAWLKVNVISHSKNHFGIGVIVKIHTDSNIYTQEINAGRGQLMQKPTVLHFGLGAVKTIKKVEVHWSKRKVEQFREVKINSSYLLIEGTGKGKEL